MELWGSKYFWKSCESCDCTCGGQRPPKEKESNRLQLHAALNDAASAPVHRQAEPVVCQHGEGETRMTSLVLYRIDSNKRMQRFYRMDLQPTQFGEWCLSREWGRIGRAGRTRSLPFPTPRRIVLKGYDERRVRP